MTDSENRSEERRAGTQRVITKMLDERQEMLVLFAKVAGLEPYAGSKASTVDLKEFCQILVDYVATAHFGVYERIAEGKERRRKVLDVAEALYPRIKAITDEVVTFNDRYEGVDGDALPDGLHDDLSSLGERIAQRIELEDQLLAAMNPA